MPIAPRSGGSNVTQTHARALRVLLETLDDLQRARQSLVSRAQKLADADDITLRIMEAAAAFEQWVEVQPAMLDDVLEEELSKFEKFHVEIEAGRAKQEALLNSIKVMGFSLWCCFSNSTLQPPGTQRTLPEVSQRRPSCQRPGTCTAVP